MNQTYGMKSPRDALNHKFLRRSLLLLAFITGAMTVRAETLSPEEVISTALRANPSLQAARARWEMMKARVPQAAAWEDLRFSADSVTGRFVSIPASSFTDQSLM